MADKVNVWAWDRFNTSLYAQVLKRNDRWLNLFKITYNYFKNSNQINNPSQTAEYIVAYDKDQAIKTWGKWKDLIIKIEKINP